MHVIQLAEHQWLVVDKAVQPRFLIVEGPLVDKATGETHVKHRVEWWSIEKSRKVLAVLDGLIGAESWCRDELARRDEEHAQLSRDLRVPAEMFLRR